MKLTVNAIMFHHFTDGKMYPEGHGAITASEFEKIIIGDGSYKIINAKDWLLKFKSGSLEKHDMCLTFDDNLKCQFDIALPILEKFNLTAFWFVYTAPFLGFTPNLELFRWFRLTKYENSDEFSYDFIKTGISFFKQRILQGLKDFEKTNYLQEFSFYSKSDREFRFLRDNVLNNDDYTFLMYELMKNRGFNWEEVLPYLSFNKIELQHLSDSGHIVGLHSHSHPTNMAKLSKSHQFTEYHMNKKVLKNLIGRDAICMAHPVNSYNAQTKKVLDKLDISLGFRSNSINKKTLDPLEVGRIDHVQILKYLEK